ncbi:trehalose utilization [Bacillus sp. AFS076308]|uniref:ThuA domain-containing protein n=1 Tax=unclassified Bacillus (in: firmicutes) TaxID=185979 RepID=UPI000BF80091|nr:MULTISPECIES: ThuA domain-containing protein [unclassified Bacillus (in: firmicutes)]PFN97246.1 trehalose utilization [Bacillus sp. AFS076308]PGV51676.1 trehalose utilization [Bacillus sp. AFS037270]
MVKLLAILGDYYHPAEWAKESLEEAIRANFGGEDVQLVFGSYETLKDELLDQPDGVVLFKENRLNPTDEIVRDWMTEGLASEITRYVSNGGGWLAWHSGLASYPSESGYTKMLRGSFLYHPEKHQVVKYTTVEKDSFLPGPSYFEFSDEHYFVQCNEANTNVFLRSESIDGQAVAGWSHSFGEGRVCCLTPAHTKHGLMNQEFLNVLGSCINWIASK